MLPEQRLVALRPAIMARMREAAQGIMGEPFGDFFDKSMRRLLIDGFRRVGAHEGTVWTLDEDREALVPRFNSGPHAAEFVGSFRQSLRTGMIGMVVAMEQAICENELSGSSQIDRNLDRHLGLRTCAMLAVPFYFAGELRGVVSGVQVKPANSDDPDPPGFSPEHLRGLQLTTGILSRLIEYRLLALCLGLEGLG